MIRSGQAGSIMKFGTVAIVGRPNVGKSTLLNRLLDQKVAIVSDKPQTTRTRILGIVHVPGAQIALLDTPGLHKPQHLLNRRMVTGAHYVGVAVCLLLLVVLIFGDMGLPRYFSMREHAQRLDVDIQELQRATRTLRGDIDRLEHDPSKIEQLAREQLGYVRKGETVYQLIPPP